MWHINKEHGSQYLVELAYNESWHSFIKMNPFYAYEHFSFKKWMIETKKLIRKY
jgi:hypothetical protein